MKRFYPKSGLLSCMFLLHFFAAHAQVHTFNLSGGSQSWTVPPNVTSIAVDAVGASGGKGVSVLYGTVFFDNFGGYGGRVQCTLDVTPGMVLQIFVGGGGDSSGHAIGGFNGGGNGLPGGWGGAGGGASDIRIWPYSLHERVVVAGGGGGGGGLVCPGDINTLKGGFGGGTVGEEGRKCYSVTSGKGGTDTAGGIGGFNGTDAAPSGLLGTGGNGAPGYYGSAGGGGGYYGGGGSVNAGGGGGSSWADATRASDIIHTPNYNYERHGVVTITEIHAAGVQAVTPGDVAVFPNPANDILTIHTGITKYNTCSITNTLGQIVMHADITSTQTQLDVKELPAGIYYLTLRGEGGANVIRFVKK